ncbi:two-component sensor histidine kinase [Cellulomonas composti]|uniref:histidine kinase n=1 Tax=Cellulomonas composti TaxID=266130 RepID=A0A511JAA8_9CELL|nr:two-component sensor histidine kinase [Cellulomonas composti]
MRVWRDWALVALFVGLAILETFLRPELPWRPVVLVEAVALTSTLLWRRTRPLLAVLVAFGVVVLVDLVAYVSGVDTSVGLASMGYVLILVYALVRWGSGREIVLGSAVVMLAAAFGVVRDPGPLPDAIAGFGIVVFAGLLGLAVRQTRVSRSRELDQVRLREREQLARELHDTVAHHVSAMVIRAQAGQVLADVDPAAARDALAVIEAEGSRTLTEMRSLVGALRQGDADLVPQGGVGDLERLAAGVPLAVSIERTGELDDLGAALDAAVYRCVQESLTNAARHGRHVRQVRVRVAADEREVHASVSDDGDPVTPGRVGAGYGLLGMTERAALLGGTMTAGPGADRGWRVDVVLPRTLS